MEIGKAPAINIPSLTNVARKRLRRYFWLNIFFTIFLAIVFFADTVLTEGYDA